MESENLVQFLESCQAHLHSILEDPRRLHLVIGNESADLDSVVSSIVYAFYLSKEAEYEDCTVLPVINTSLRDIYLRTEVVAVFNKVGMSEKLLIYINDVNLEEIREARLLSLSLVDHNALSLKQAFLKQNVKEIIDHHKDEGYFKDEDVSKTIVGVGSCCTLIAEQIINNRSHYLHIVPIAELLLASILGDTQNLSSQTGRTTEYDIEVSEELQEYVENTPEDLYEFVATAKYDINALSSIDILRKDFKSVSVKPDSPIAGVSSITMETIKFFARDDTTRSIMTYCSVQKLDLFILMFIWSVHGTTKRELVVFSLSEQLLSLLDVHLKGCRELGLRDSKTLNDLESSQSKYFLAYEQENINCSRKVLLPVVADFLNTRAVDETLELTFHSCKDIFTPPNDAPGAKDDREEHFAAEAREMKQFEQSTPCDITDEDQPVFLFNNGSPPPASEIDTPKMDESIVFKDEEIIKKVEEEIESFENEKNNLSRLSKESQVPYIRTQSELEFERLMYGSVTSERSISMETDTESVTGKRSDSFIRQLINEAYAADEAEMRGAIGDEWDSGGLKKESESNTPNAKAFVYIKELSFDFEEKSEVHGSDVFAPVFLAVTEEEEDEPEVEEDEDSLPGSNRMMNRLGLKNMRKKAQSIENLVVIGPNENEISSHRSRSKSDIPFRFRKKTGSRKQGKKLEHRRSYDDNFNTEYLTEEVDQRTPSDRLGRKFFSQGDGLDESESNRKQNRVKFHDDQFLKDPDYEDRSLFPSVRLEIQEDDGPQQENAVRTKSVNTAAFKKLHKSVERLFFDVEEQRGGPDGCSDDVHESIVSYTIQGSPHVRGLWNRFITVNVGIQQRIVDLELIEPYMKVISHGGFCYNGDKRQTVMVFTACYLPKRTVKKYTIIMEQLFYYVIHTLDLLVENEYVLVYFNSAIDSQAMPKKNWLRECYYMIDRRLKKSLKNIYIVHPNFWLRAMVKFYRPFISSKFYRKIKFISTLGELGKEISTEYVFIPDEVRRADPEYLYWSRRL